MSAAAAHSGTGAAPLTVDQVVQRAAALVRYDPVLSRLVVEGELTDIKRQASGHVYFTLRGERCSVSCVMWRSSAQSVRLWPKAGDRVLIAGDAGVYEERGAFQLYAKKIAPLGAGALARAREELRRRLEQEGLFSAARKRPLPSFPKRAACVTADTGAAVRDVIRQFRNRYPLAELIIVPCLVQGIYAPESACEALRKAASIPGVEAVLLVRGGGSREDLSAFDDEDLVREVARCAVPVVCGIGHEVDQSLCDLAADLSAPTPTAAAAALFPDRGDVLKGLNRLELQLRQGALHRLSDERRVLENTEDSATRCLARQFGSAAQRLDSMDEQLTLRIKNRIERSGSLLRELQRSLENLSPRRLAERGYSMVLCGEQPLLSASQVRPGDVLRVQLLDGEVSAKAESVSRHA